MTVTKPIVPIKWNAFIDIFITIRPIMLSAFLFLLLHVPSYSTIRYVKAGNPNPIAPYTSWATASDSIQKVVNICINGDTIMIGNGVYKEMVRSERTNIILSFMGTDVDSCIFDLSDYPPEGGEYNSFYLKCTGSPKSGIIG